MAWYRTGAVSLTTGSNIVTGTGTDWKKNINGIGQGQALVANKTRVEIMYVDSDTQIRLAEPWNESAYSGTYHIETAFAGTTGDSARQVMAALFLWKQMGVDWDEWLTSEAATVEVTNVFGEKVTIPTWKALSGASTLMDAVYKIETPAQTIIFKHDVLAKEIGVGYPRDGATPASRFGYHSAGSTTPRLYMTDGANGATLQFVMRDGTVATREWVNTMIGADIRAAWLINPNGSMWWGAHDDYLYAKQNGKTYVNLEIDKSDNIKATGFLHTMSAGDYTSFKMWRKAGAVEDGGVLFQTAPWDSAVDGKTAFGIVEQTGKFGVSSTNRNAWNFAREGTGRIVATRQWVYEATGWGVTGMSPAGITNHNSLTTPTGMYYYGTPSANKPATSVGFGSAIVTRYSTDISHHLYINNYGSSVLAVRRMNGTSREDYHVLTSNNWTVDSNGFYKRASPIIVIKHSGYSTNKESRGATVSKLSTGCYHIRNILGYNEDGAWGINGGISVPKDVNGLELVYVKDEIQPDGSIIVRTYHRQHSHLPEMFQNTRKKPDGSTYKDGEPCDLPVYTGLDIRVGMPSDSIYNRQQTNNIRRMILSDMLEVMQKVLSDNTLYLSAPADI